MVFVVVAKLRADDVAKLCRGRPFPEGTSGAVRVTIYGTLFVVAHEVMHETHKPIFLQLENPFRCSKVTRDELLDVQELASAFYSW